MYHSWRANNTRQSSTVEDRQHRAPVLEQNTSLEGACGIKCDAESDRERYFRVPFLRPVPEQLNKNRGWWYAHFKGRWIVRQLEIYPNTAPLLLIAGKGQY